MPDESILNKYINIHISLPEEKYELAYAYIQYFHFMGIEEKIDELVITFDSIVWNYELRDELLENLKLIDNSVKIIKEETIAEKNWNEEWESEVSPIFINDRIVITPEWKQDEVNNEIKILINPKMSFGTGHHATTRLVCKMMESVIKPDSFVIDAGTGTGVLAILALRLGAGKVIAFDNNIWSLENAKENFVLNKCDDKIELFEQDIYNYEFPDADCIVANLFLNLLLPSFNKFYKCLSKNHGNLLVSGVMVYYIDELISEAEKNGFKTEEVFHEDEWISVNFQA